MAPVLANADELYFERGGPIQRFGQRLATKWGLGHSVHVRILSFLIVTWLPLLIFALIEGRAWTASPREALLLDFATYARFFLAVPLLIVAELIVGPQLRAAGLQFVHGGFIRADDHPAFDRAIASAARWRESPWAEVIILGAALAGAWSFTAEIIYGEGLSTWRATTRITSTGEVLSLTGLWYRLVALPVLLFFWYRWIWRLFVWSRFLWTVSRLNLNLVATHADQAGGLGFLGTAHASLGIFAFGLSSVLSAEAAFLMVFQGAPMESFKVPFAALLVIVQLMFLGPLLMFVPLLIRARLTGLREYGLLVDQYNRAFHEKWISNLASAGEPLLGSSDIQSLADLGNSFAVIKSMKAIPFSTRVVLQLAVITSLPCLPLILLVVPISTILDILTKAMV